MMNETDRMESDVFMIVLFADNNEVTGLKAHDLVINVFGEEIRRRSWHPAVPIKTDRHETLSVNLAAQSGRILQGLAESRGDKFCQARPPCYAFS